MGDWFKVHRSIIESAVFEDAEVFKIWMYILCKASYYEHDAMFQKSVVHIKIGEFATGRKKIARETGISESRVYRALKILEQLGNINIKSNSKYSMISVVNWGKYQSDTQNLNIKFTTNAQQTNSKPTTSEQQTNTTKESKESKECKEVEEVVVPTTTTTKNDLPFYSSADYEEEEEEEEEDPEYDKLRKLGGRCEGLILSGRQMDDLIETMGDIDVFEMYCQKLIKFIKEKGATNIKSHYATLLKWYKQDTKTK